MKSTILLVEDNEEMLEVIGDVLNDNYQILTASDGQQALERLEIETIHLIVSDIMMPVMDGFEFCKIIKSNLEYSHIPVILLTAKTTLQSKIEGLELGADAYIEKPFVPKHLKVQIANLLANRSRLKEYFTRLPLVHLKSIANTRTDEVFLVKLNEAIQANFEDQELDVNKLARLINMSRTNLFRKIKSISDLTPHELINLTRLKKAAELLAGGNFKIYEVCDMVGFNSQNNFTKNFLKQFGMTPTDYQKLMHSDKADQ